MLATSSSLSSFLEYLAQKIPSENARRFLLVASVNAIGEFALARAGDHATSMNKAR